MPSISAIGATAVAACCARSRKRADAQAAMRSPQRWAQTLEPVDVGAQRAVDRLGHDDGADGPGRRAVRRLLGLEQHEEGERRIIDKSVDIPVS